jgi:hypothetical protein
VRFDGLIHLHGDGVLDVAANTTNLPEALRFFDLVLRAAEQRGGDVSVTKLRTINLDGEKVSIRMREGSERRRKEVGKQGFPQERILSNRATLANSRRGGRKQTQDARSRRTEH